MTALFLALLPGDGLVLGAGHLLAHLARDAPTHRLGRGAGGAVGGRRLELQGDVGQGEDEGGDQEYLHGESRRLTDFWITEEGKPKLKVNNFSQSGIHIFCLYVYFGKSKSK